MAKLESVTYAQMDFHLFNDSSSFFCTWMAFGEENAASLAEMAEKYYRMGRFTEAVPLRQRSLAIC